MAKDKPLAAAVADVPATVKPPKPVVPVWHLCEFRGNVSRYILAANADEAAEKYWRSIGVVDSIHEVKVTPLPDYKPTAEDLDTDARLSLSESPGHQPESHC